MRKLYQALTGTSVAMMVIYMIVIMVWTFQDHKSLSGGPISDQFLVWFALLFGIPTVLVIVGSRVAHYYMEQYESRFHPVPERELVHLPVHPKLVSIVDGLYYESIDSEAVRDSGGDELKAGFSDSEEESQPEEGEEDSEGKGVEEPTKEFTHSEEMVCEDGGRYTIHHRKKRKES